ncbi:hypothetical protein [Streptomyces sp. AS58]|uniref:hypothetical protein n=1 Tax=Streptomyces sp. AS58 TaxID=1519489 RepID=UPI000A528DBA|nr:hypothetical protein [Streptomyces sp. AS58]
MSYRVKASRGRPSSPRSRNGQGLENRVLRTLRHDTNAVIDPVRDYFRRHPS